MTTSVLPRPDVAPARPWSFPKAERFELANGISVVAVDLPGKYVVAIRLLLDLPVGADPAGYEGAASIAMGALDEGTERYDAQGFALARNLLGATYGAGADANGATVSLDVPVTRLADAVDLLAEAVLRPTFPAAEVDRLVQQRLDGIRMELASPDARASIELARAFYRVGSRRSIPNGGTTESVTRIDRDVVEAHYRAQVDPATTTVVVAGDLGDVDLRGLLDATFGSWATSGRVRTPLVEDDVVAGPGVVVVDRPGAVQTNLSLAAPAVSRKHPDFAPLAVAAYALGGGVDSRLMKVLREEKGYTYGVRAMVAPSRDDGLLFVGGAVQTDVTAPAVADLIDILRAAADGFGELERSQAVEQLAGRAPLQYEVPSAVAGTIASLIANGLPDDHIDTELAALRATSVDSVNAAYTRSIALDRAVLVAIGDGSVITEPLRAAGLGDVTVVTA